MWQHATVPKRVGSVVKSHNHPLAFVVILAVTWLSVAGCGAKGSEGSGISASDATIHLTTAIDEEWNRCASALDEEWPNYTLGLVDTAGPMDLPGITESATVCTATGPQGQLLWLALTVDDRRVVFVAGSDGLPTPAP